MKSASLALDTQGNTCTGCHRIGSQHTCQEAMAQTWDPTKVDGLDEWGHQWPQSHWMPPDNLWTEAQWAQIYPSSIKALERCCKDPKAEGCLATPIAESARGADPR